MRAIDRRAIEEYGIPGVCLMQSAGDALARVCIEELGGTDIHGKRVVFFCGMGNNGGDGFVAARHLADRGAHVFVLLAGKSEDLKGDAAVHFAPLRRMMPGGIYEETPGRKHPMPLFGAENTEDDETARIVLEDGILRIAHLFVDCLLGTGARGPIDRNGAIGRYLFLLNRMRGFPPRKTPVIAADVPSGVNADTGKADYLSVRATRTVTFALPKPGLFTFPAPDYVGKLTVAAIGMPRDLLEADTLTQEVTTQDFMRLHLPRRAQTRDANKGTFGTVLVIAGSAGMAGAASLTALSALRAGAGLVVLAVPESVLDTAAALAPEAVLKTLPETANRAHGGTGALEAALALAEKADAVAIGPGMGGTNETVAFVQAFVQACQKPLLIDADGLNAVAQMTVAAPPLAGRKVVLTPHPGEAGRLLNRDAKAIQENRLQTVRELATKWGATALLKGARTLVAEPNNDDGKEGRLAFNRLGSPALATAGSGDVLTGVIAALLAYMEMPYEAARAGAYLHALAGELYDKETGSAGALATDIRDLLPRAREALYTNDHLDEFNLL